MPGLQYADVCFSHLWSDVVLCIYCRHRRRRRRRRRRCRHRCRCCREDMDSGNHEAYPFVYCLHVCLHQHVMVRMCACYCVGRECIHFRPHVCLVTGEPGIKTYDHIIGTNEPVPPVMTSYSCRIHELPKGGACTYHVCVGVCTSACPK